MYAHVYFFFLRWFIFTSDNMYGDDEVELQEMKDGEVGHQEIKEEEMEQVERGEKLDEFKKYLFVTVKAILCVE